MKAKDGKAMTVRALRVDDPLWFEMLEVTKAEGENLSAVMRRYMRGHIKRHKAKAKASATSGV